MAAGLRCCKIAFGVVHQTTLMIGIKLPKIYQSLSV